MKKTNLLLSAILIICISFTSFKGASNKESLHKKTPKTEISKKEVSPSETLVGKWVLMNLESKSKKIKDTEGIMGPVKKILEGKLYYDFKADNTYIFYSPHFMGQQEKIDKGIWSLSRNNKTLTITESEDKKKKKFTIVALNQKSLVISRGDKYAKEIMAFTKE